MFKKSRTFSLAKASLFAILVALAAASAPTESFAQQAPKKVTMTSLIADITKKMEAQDYKGAVDSLKLYKSRFWDRLPQKNRALADFTLTNAYYQMSDWANAEIALKDFCAIYKDEQDEEIRANLTDAMVTLADVYIQQKKWADARDQLTRLSKLASLPAAKRLKMGVFRAEVIQKEAEETGDEDKIKQGLATAEELLKKLTAGIGNTPEAIDAKQRLVQVYQKQGKRREAEALKNEIDSAGTKDPASVIRSNYQGLGLGDSYFQQAMDTSEEDQQRELFREALARYQGVLRKNALLTYFAPAIDAARKKLEVFKEKVPEPNDDQAAQLEKLQGNLDELESFKTEFENNKDYDAYISFRIGACLLSMRRPWEAYVAFEDIVSNHKDFEKITLATYYYIACLRQLGRSAEAQTQCKKYIEKFPKGEEIGEIALMLGQISFEQGDYISAIESFTWAKKNVPNLEIGTKCELDWYTITAWFARCPWGLGVKEEDIAGMGKPGYVPKLTQATQDTIALIDQFVKDYGEGRKAFENQVEEMLYRKGLLYFFSGFYKETKEAMTSYVTDHPKGIFVPDARYRMAIAKFGARYKDKKKDLENLEEVFGDCRAWLKDYFEVTDQTLLNENFIAPVRKEDALPFRKENMEDAIASVQNQRPEIYTLLADSYKRIAEGIKPPKRGKMPEHDAARKERATNDMIRAYMLAAKTARNNPDTLRVATGELDKLLAGRGEWQRLLDLYNTLYDWNPDSSEALLYLDKRISYTERLARTQGDDAKEKAKQDAKGILAAAILKNINDPAQENVEELIYRLASRLAKESMLSVRQAENAKKRVEAAALAAAEAEKNGQPAPVVTLPPIPPPESIYTPAKAAEEMLALLKLDGKDPNAEKPTLIGLARGAFARAMIYQLTRNDSEYARYMRNIAATYKPDELGPTILAEVGNFLYNSGELDKAEPFYRYLMDNYRSAYRADSGFAGIGKICLDRKEFRKAYETFNDALENGVYGEEELALRIGRARALIGLPKADAAQLEISDPFERALKDLNFVLAVKDWKYAGGHAQAFYYKGQLEEARGKPNEAVTYYRNCYLTQGKWKEFAAPAMLRAGVLFEEKLGQRDAAAQIYYEMSQPKHRFAGTDAAKEAARRALKLPYTPPTETPAAAPAAPAGTPAAK